MFPFHKSILETGVWRELSMGWNSKAAHAVYCVCRAYGFQDAGLYNDSENTNFTDVDFWAEVYPKRGYDFLQADIDVIAEKGGVTINTAKKAMDVLMDSCMLSWDDGADCYRVFIKPPKYFTREYINAELEKTQEQPMGMHTAMPW